MNKSILLVVGVALLLMAGLYSLPRVVVRNKDRKLTKQQTTGTRSAVGDAAVLHTDSSLHLVSVSPAQQQELNRLRGRLESAGTKQAYAIGEELIQAYQGVSRFDSAAWVAERLVQLTPTEQAILRAADCYYEAYGFMVDKNKSAFMGQKAREYYQKALDSNPHLLAAKANMAMTYVTTSTPMQGISLLREVLQQDPTNVLALFNMGLLSMRSGQYARAVDRFRSILANQPTNSKAQFYLAISLSELGKKNEAKQLLVQLKEKEKDPTIQAAIRELEKEL